MASLTKRQEGFARDVARGLNQTEAYRNNYTTDNSTTKSISENASRLMKNSKVLSMVDELKAAAIGEVKKKLAIDKEWVMKELVEIVQMGKASEPVLDKEGNTTGEYKPQLGAANKALELIGKEFGMFVDRKEIRSGTLDDVPHEEKLAALEAVRNELEKRRRIMQVH